MKVQVVLPLDFQHAIGGYAVAYEYAGQLARRGHEVEVVHLDPDLLRRVARHPRSELRRERRLRSTGPSWYPVPTGVRVRSVVALGRSTREADVVVATAWRTAEAVVAAGVRTPRGFYLLQHDEVWDGPEGRVRSTWQLPLTRIVISGWLADLARDLGALPVHQIPNGIDTRLFEELVPKEQRPAASVAMMWHEATWKASAVGLQALAEARSRRPDLTAHLFSVFDRPAGLPEWVVWHEGVSGRSLCEVYSSCAVFVSPSLAEGWPLPPAEAMASGCCLVSTDIPGVADYAHDGSTALLVPPADPSALAEAVLRVVEDDALRLRLAAAGQALVREEFSWKRAADRMEALLTATARPTP